MTRQAIMLAIMETALYANQIASGALRPAELDACPEVYYGVVERPAQIFDACMLGLETLYVRLEPLVNMGNT